MNRRDFWTAFILGIIAFSSIAFTINHPGLTWDEANFIPSSLSYLNWFQQIKSLKAFTHETITDCWLATHEHPPLAKLLSMLSIVLFHKTVGLITAARLSTAFCFSLLIISVYFLTRHFRNWQDGLFAGLSLLIMPRVFGHAHLAALDIPMSLMSVLVVLAFLKGLNNWKWSLALGVFFGLAMATKLNALFLPLLLTPWAHIYHHRKKCLDNLMAMFFISSLIFLATWPWLWVDTVSRLTAYLTMKFHHGFIPVYYLGQTYWNTPPPWHYPLLMTALTIPVGLLITGLLGIIRVISSSEHRDIGMLIIINAFFPILLMSMPHVPKYDGVRLFLPAFPFLAILAGIGLGWITNKIAGCLKKDFLPPSWPSCALLLGLAFLAINAWPLADIHPYHLSYYNALAEGTKGANKRGLEITYWGDSLTQQVFDYLNQQPKETQVHFFPIGCNVVPLLKASGQLRPDMKISDRANADLLVLNCRQGFFDKGLWKIYKEKEPVAGTFYQGIPLTAVYRMK